MARRIGGVLLALVVAAAAVAGLILILQSRDDPDVGNPGAQGPGRPASVQDVPASVRQGSRTLTRTQLEELLDAGNVVLLHGSAGEPRELTELAESATGGPFDPAVADAGQAVIIAREAGAQGFRALAYRRQIRAPSAGDPALADFVDFWLGQGAPG